MNVFEKDGCRLVNLTGHPIEELDAGVKIGPAPHDDILRVEKLSPRHGNIAGISVFNMEYEVQNVPKQQDNTWYIVSRSVADAIAIMHPERRDFLCCSRIEHEQVRVPLKQDGKLVKDKDGNIVTVVQTRVKGCRGLSYSVFLSNTFEKE